MTTTNHFERDRAVKNKIDSDSKLLFFLRGVFESKESKDEYYDSELTAAQKIIWNEFQKFKQRG